MERYYQPIDCNQYDQLILLAMRKQAVEIVYRVREQKICSIRSVIRDVYTQDKAEFILTESGLPIRLDQLIAVDGIQMGKSCGIGKAE